MELQEHFRKPMRHTKKNDVFYLFACPAQAGAQYFNQPHGNARMLSQQLDEIAPFDDHDLTAFGDDRIRGARTLIEKSNFTEDIAWRDQVEYSVVSLFG